eukprot:s166_g1.t1
MAGFGGPWSAPGARGMALSGLLGLINYTQGAPGDHDNTEDHPRGRREEMGGGPLQHQPSFSFLLAGYPREEHFGELDSQKGLKGPWKGKGKGAALSADPTAWPNVPPVGDGGLWGIPHEENWENLETAQVGFPPQLPPLPETSNTAEQQGTLGRTWATVKGWMSPKKQPLGPPGGDLQKQNIPQRRLDVPQLRPNVKGKGKGDHKFKLGRALNAARVLKDRGLKAPSIEKSFSAASSLGAKNAKKRTAARILETLAGGKEFLPLTQEMLKGLASALQEGGYKAGEGYLIEAKLWHIEKGHPWTDALDRAFKQCKRALARGQGPKKKAAEVPRELRAHPLKLKFSQADKAVKFGRELFIFATAWMLREIELAGITTEDLMIDHLSKKVTLHLRMSKTDSEGKGVRRTLQCLCTGRCCDWECPYVLSKDLVEKVENFNGTTSALTLTKGKKLATKDQIVKTWRQLFGQGVSGHSGRRTGALHYIRSGWAISQVAHLGRWKSSAILAYAEEALEQMPANLHAPCTTLDQKGLQVTEQKFISEDELRNWKNLLQREIKELKAEVQEKHKENDAQFDNWAKIYKENPGSLPRKLQSLPSKVIHWNLARSTASPPITWRTACGWSYYGSNFTFTEPDVELTCQKWHNARLSSTLSKRVSACGLGGFFSAVPGATQCTKCPTGTYSVFGRTCTAKVVLTATDKASKVHAAEQAKTKTPPQQVVFNASAAIQHWKQTTLGLNGPFLVAGRKFLIDVQRPIESDEGQAYFWELRNQACGNGTSSLMSITAPVAAPQALATPIGVHLSAVEAVANENIRGVRFSWVTRHDVI